ncbi:hypothetical protein [Streptomyces sp. CB01635]|uniref:hypothetical protein n=1 Tax=unclassified Streptomyces TaxID=2593676 RepID=UPI0018FE10A9|nr:hypothetical protein [Streptomyces sp. CB01635]
MSSESAYVELSDLLPSVTEYFGPDHPAALDAGHAYAWSAGRTGRAQEGLCVAPS